MSRYFVHYCDGPDKYEMSQGCDVFYKKSEAIEFIRKRALNTADVALDNYILIEGDVIQIEAVSMVKEIREKS